MNEQEKQILDRLKSEGKSFTEAMSAIAQVRTGQATADDYIKPVTSANIAQQVDEGYSFSDLGGDIKETFSGVGDVWKDRYSDIAETKQDYAEGKIPLAMGMADTVLEAGKGALQTVGTGIIGAAKAFLPQSTEDKIAGGVASGVQHATENYELSPEFQIGKDNVVNWYSELKQTNPIAARAIEMGGDFGEIAAELYGAGKVKKGVNLAGEGVDKVKQTVADINYKDILPEFEFKKPELPSVKSVGDVVDAPIEKAASYIVKKESAGALLNRAIKPSAAGVKKTRVPKTDLEEIAKIVIADGHKPTDIQSLADAVKTSTKNTWDKVKTVLAREGKSTNIPTQGIINKIDNGLADKTILVTSPSDMSNLQRLKESIINEFGDTIDIDDAQLLQQRLNAGITGKQVDFGDAYVGIAKDISREIGDSLDTALSDIPSELKSLKAQYGKLASYRDDIFNRAIVASRQSPDSIVQGLSRAEGVASAASGIVKGQPGEAIKGVVQVGLGKASKYVNDSDFLIKEAFEKLSKTDNPVGFKGAGVKPKSQYTSADKALVTQNNKVVRELKSKESELKKLMAKPKTSQTTKLIEDIKKVIVKLKAQLNEVKTKMENAGLIAKKGEGERGFIAGSDKADDLVSEAKKYKTADEFVESQDVPFLEQGKYIDIWKGAQVKNPALKKVKKNEQLTRIRKEVEELQNKSNYLDTVNPTGGLMVDYTPKVRATQKINPNEITTLDKTLGGSPDDIITVYRGAPKTQSKIVPGDFISDNYDVAKGYTGEGNVLSLKVRKGDVLDEINGGGNEYLYRPKADKEITSLLADKKYMNRIEQLEAQLKEIWKKANK